MKKVLFIEYFFPPLEANFRAIAFAKYMPSLGWLPVVVSAAETVSYGKDYSTLEGIPSEIRVHRVGHRQSPKLWNMARARLRLAADFPDEYKSWFAPAYKAAENIIRSEKIDLIYSSSPTFTTAMVAMALRNKYGIPWVADFPDGWAVNDFLLDHLSRSVIAPLRKLLTTRIQRAERQVLTTADAVVSVHHHVVERWKDLHRIEGNNIRTITEGYEEASFHGLSPRDLAPGRLKITFTGSYYPQFFDTIRTFLTTVQSIDPTIEVFFIGRGLESVHRMNVSNTTCIMNVPKRKALEYALGSDFLYVVMPPYGRWTPSKTYDYFRLGKPILASFPSDGDAAMHVLKARCGFVLPYEQSALERALREIFAGYPGEIAQFKPDEEYIRSFDRRLITQNMVDVFNSTLARRS